MLTYAEAKAKLERARDGRRKLENNTYLEWRGVGEIAVRLHGTDVVTIHEDGSYTLNSGGWRTVTTKDRINSYAPVRLFSDRGEWYVSGRGDWSGPRWAFADGINILIAGGEMHVSGAVADRAGVRRRVLRMVNRYVKGYAASVKGKGLEKPGPGDCWGCALVPAGDGPVSVPTRDGSWHAKGPKLDKPPGARDITGVDHYLSHFEEQYYVPSLMWRAVNQYPAPYLMWGLINSELKQGKTDLLNRTLKRHFRPLIPALVDAVAGRGEGAEVETGVGRE